MAFKTYGDIETMKKILLALIIFITLPAHAFELNNKKWAEDKALILLPKTFNTELMRKRMSLVARQFRNNVPFKVKGRYHDLRYDSILDVINYAAEYNLIVVLYEPGETMGLGNRLANASFITSQGGTKVHGGVIRINDIRLQEVAGGALPNYYLNYLANITWHEVGHLFGLDHADHRIRPKPIMLSSGKFSKLKRLGLAKDDKRGLRRIYQ